MNVNETVQVDDSRITGWEDGKSARQKGSGLKNVLILAALCACLLLSACGKKGAVLKDTAISHEPEFGGVYVLITIDDFNKLGFKYGDSLNVTFSNGYKAEGIPYYNGYYTHNGEPLVVAYPGYPYVKVCINNGNDLWEIAKLSDSDKATITVAKEGAFLSIQEARDIHYKDDRTLFAGDEIFANFRAMKVTGLKENTLYRSASPCDNQHNRAPYVDKLIEGAGVKTIIDLADTTEKIENYIKKDDFNSPYFLSLYKNGSVFPIALNMNFDSDGFREKLAGGIKAIIENEGPYLIHCTEGKDRTGFVCLLLEAFCGATYDEIVKDYMITYDNYYQISSTNQKDKYETIIKDVLNPMVQNVAGDEKADIKTVDLSACATAYMKKLGLTDDQINALRDRLCTK